MLMHLEGGGDWGDNLCVCVYCVLTLNPHKGILENWPI